MPSNGAALARRGCVYVSVNYRLGALGCLDLSSLSTPDHPIDDNLFLRDIVLALQWVQDNIGVFGGDPDNVTIFGESAGAHAVATLLAVPAAEGLFHQAISESPASGMSGTPTVAAEFAADFVEALGSNTGDGAAAVMAARPAQLVDALRDTPRTASADLTWRHELAAAAPSAEPRLRCRRPDQRARRRRPRIRPAHDRSLTMTVTASRRITGEPTPDFARGLGLLLVS